MRATLLLLVLLAACRPVEPTPDPTPTPTPTVAPLPDAQPLPGAIASAFAEEAEDLGATGATLAIRHGDQLYVGTWGSRDPSSDDPVLATTLFRIGSTTKMMTATAVLSAVDRGELSLDDPAADFLGPLPLIGRADFDDVTLHHLLSHTSGLSEITPLDGGASDDRLLDYTHSAAFPQNVYVMAPAGEFWNYSNTNFSLAGAALEAHDGRGYRSIMAQDVFGPLGMDRTVFLGSEVEADGDFAESWTYDWTGASQTPVLATADSYDDGWARPAGFAWSSALDMIRWGWFLMRGDDAVLGPAQHDELAAAHVNTREFRDHLGYGYGVMLWDGHAVGSTWFDVASQEHGGAIPGYATDLVTVPEHDLAYVTLAAGDGAYFGALRGVIYEDLLGETATAVPDSGVADDDLGRYVGTYKDPYNVGTLIVSLDGGLHIEAPLLDDLDIPYSSTLTHLTEGGFRWGVQGSSLGVSFLGAPGEPTRWFRTRVFVGERDGARDGDSGDPARVRSWVQGLRRSR